MIKKIQVLLIDDYPSFALTKVANASSLKEVSLSDSQKEKSIPSIEEFQTEKREISSTKVLKPSAVTLETEKIEFSKYFELKWLRNADDIQLFRKLCQDIEEEHSPSRLGEDDGFVPEVVLFDYALTGHEDMNYPNESDDMEILQRSVPIYNLKKILTDKDGESKTHTIEPFDLSVFEIESGLNSDNIGCIGGVLTVSYFRNHPCIGIATTRKSDEHLKGQEAKFVEGLVKEPHQFDFSLRGNNNNLNWETLLKRSASNLRERIKILIQSSKITPSLSQLIELAGGTITDRVFTFQTVYGLRHLPLDGLFIDVENDKRDGAIKNWAGELIEMFEWEDYKIASEKSKTLLDAFKGELFEHRMKLSELAIRVCNKEEINNDDKEKLNNLLDEFGVVNAKSSLTPETLSKANLTKKVIDFRTETENLNSGQKRLVVLFTDLRLHLAWQKFKTINQNSTYNPDILNLLISPPTLSELRAALFPVSKNPLILDYHRELLSDKKILNKNIFEAWEKAIGEHLKNDKIFSKTEFPINLKDGEIRLAKSFALKNGLRNECLPNWLKNK